MHRDIKLDNILIGADGKIKLSDFASVIIAKNKEEASKDRNVGSIDYWAPELLENESSEY